MKNTTNNKELIWLSSTFQVNTFVWRRQLKKSKYKYKKLNCFIFFFTLGYAFLLFQEESSVQALIDACIEEDGKLYLCVSSPTIKDKPVSKQ